MEEASKRQSLLAVSMAASSGDEADGGDGPGHVSASARSAEGLCQRRFDVYCESVGPDRIVVRRQEGWTSWVSVLSGGGSGHEPAHAGFVGDGLLAAAVCGKVFTSPSREAVQRAVALLGGRPTLVVVKNYTGDRVNFGLAIEASRRATTDLRLLVVGDDVAISERSMRRGVAGTVMVHKVAGEASRRGASLQRVFELASGVAENVRSLGVAFRACSRPSPAAGGAASPAAGDLDWAGGEPSFDVPPGFVEYGVGIHGERGVRIACPPTLRALCDRMLQRLLSEFDAAKLQSCALLVNNLGALSGMMLNEVAGTVLDLLARRGVRVQCAAAGTAMSALDMRGFSLSLLPFYSGDEEVFLTDLLCHPVPGVPDWVPFVRVSGSRISFSASREFLTGASPTSPAELSPPPDAHRFDGGPLLRRLAWIAASLEPCERELAELDRVAGDGDLGESVQCGVRAVIEFARRQDRARAAVAAAHNARVRGARAGPTELNGVAIAEYRSHEWPFDSVAAFFTQLAEVISRSMGGTFGALLAVLLHRMAGALHDTPQPTPLHWVTAMHSGMLAVKDIGGADLGDRTMLDAMQPALEHVLGKLLADPEPDAVALQAMLRDAADVALRGAESTALLNPRKGRAFYLQNILEGLVTDHGCDPGVDNDRCVRSIDGGALLVARMWKSFADSWTIVF